MQAKTTKPPVIQFGINFEIKRVQNTLKKNAWYVAKNINPRLPGSIKLTNGSLKYETIKAIIKKEYKEKNFLLAKRVIEESYLRITEKLEKILKHRKNKEVINPTIFLTNYGTDGSYEKPNTVVVNISGKTDSEIINILIHEMLHLHCHNKNESWEANEEIVNQLSQEERGIDIFGKK